MKPGKLLIAAGLSCLVLLSGCSGGGGDAPTTPATQNNSNSSSGTTTTGDTSSGSGSSSNTGTSTSTAPYLLDSITRSLITAAEPGDISSKVIQCTVMLHQDQSCSLSELPLIGMETQDPTVDDVMKRVVVTHAWMGTRFRELLQLMPHDLLLMTRALTGVVISSNIRPSFYTVRTGAIYLDPESMWLTPEEKANISTRPDPRTADVQSLDFMILWRYEQNETDIRALPRNLESLKLRMAALLFHELAHANDYFSPDRFDTINRLIAVYMAAGSNSSIPSARLSDTYPLQSTLMQGLAQVAFQGVTPSQTQLSISPGQVALEFPADVANDFYNYSTRREDLAVQFEEAMMLYSFGVARDEAVTNSPTDPQSCSEYVVSWGERTRMGKAAVGARSVYAVQQILPEAAAGVEAMVDSLPAPTQMLEGVDWCTNIHLDTTASASRSLVVPAQAPAQVPVKDHVQFLRPYL